MEFKHTHRDFTFDYYNAYCFEFALNEAYEEIDFIISFEESQL